ncbi:MAG TPA: LapA family protein [Gammaproteobacteria bacterium]|nr:LapA family protein [Gammaproteobacteria bacterium]
MVTLRRLGFVAVLLVLMLMTGVFAYSNPESIDIDIGLKRFEQVPMAAAFAIVLAVGWLLGLLSAAIALWRSAGEKRRLKQDLKYAEAELRTRQPSA